MGGNSCSGTKVLISLFVTDLISENQQYAMACKDDLFFLGAQKSTGLKVQKDTFWVVQLFLFIKLKLKKIMFF